MEAKVNNFQNNAKDSNIILTSESNEIDLSVKLSKIFSYNGHNVSFIKTSYGILLNATQMAKAFNKKPAEYLRLPSVNQLIKSMVGFSHLSDNQIVTTMLLGCLQRRMSRKKEGSNRYKKAKHDVAVCHERIRNRRQDFLHKVSKKIVSENQAIIIEDLNVKGMLKNHCLAKGIASASWSEFFRMLQYKSDWRGVNLIRIGRFEPSSKMCGCGYIHRDLKLSDRIWTCPECGAVNDRDLLAANNIKKFGLEKQNLLTQENINKTPVVNWEGDVELSAVAGAVKRQNVLV